MINVEVLTPRKIELQTEATCLVLPTLAGELSILPKHVPLISVLRAGKMKIKTKEKEIAFEIEGGILEFSNDKAVILLKNFYI